MTISRESSPRSRNATPDPKSRRTALTEMLGIMVVLAIPIGTAAVTARPIPNPPNRKVMNILPPQRQEIELEQRKEKRRRKKAAEKQAEDNRSPRAKRERSRSRAAERRASRP